MNEINLTMINVIMTLVILFLNASYGFYITAMICCLAFLIILGIGLIAVWADKNDQKDEEK